MSKYAQACFMVHLSRCCLRLLCPCGQKNCQQLCVAAPAELCKLACNQQASEMFSLLHSAPELMLLATAVLPWSDRRQHQELLLQLSCVSWPAVRGQVPFQMCPQACSMCT